MSLQRVGIAMSGGVDSTMAASLLLGQGYAVHGFFMILPLPSAEHQRTRVQEVANKLSLPLHFVDLRRQFTAQVIRSFIDSYLDGQTPNPCMLCNHHIKFGLLADFMMNKGMDIIATGHYARVQQHGHAHFLARGVDRHKDQSYFLARIPGNLLENTLFPLGEWSKDQVYRRAADLGFQFQGEESQDVCFLSRGLSSFLTGQGVQEQDGAIVDRYGTILGRHKGIWNYTIGQRRGLALPDATPWYVTGLDGEHNRVIVGKHTDLFVTACTVEDLQWRDTFPALPWQGLVQVRSRHTPAATLITETGPGRWHLAFDTPQRAVTPGQFAVFYHGDQVLGSAVIARAARETAWS
ncbi:tRNA 2-thiouridine(34) synthase MnmA [Desulfobulbus alkaliphilus]|uniref:tRNA 2-thiouridine(34) synthase MnmA n=1 Tax=Desulfobulbus alkaliphilus TaxID=869814 RepID=UPI0019650C4F|nr:tRNA 2-thiouridine(34) synthase MnmA [Desulfobulbus alkaliphilus]MBM9538329.1 tRNA 2-thiouridine(34) synthase MnmA [Desulfobulbus alkaliphilus]